MSQAPEFYFPKVTVCYGHPVGVVEQFFSGFAALKTTHLVQILIVLTHFQVMQACTGTHALLLLIYHGPERAFQYKNLLQLRKEKTI